MSESFEEMMEKFQKEPGLAPVPPKSQKEIEKVQNEGRKQVIELTNKLDKLDNLIKTNPEEAKLEFFNIEYLVALIPDVLKTNQLTDRIKNMYSKIQTNHLDKTTKIIDTQKKQHSEELKKPTPADKGYTFEDVSSDLGLGKSNEDRFMDSLEIDEKLRVQENVGGKPKSIDEDEQDLKDLQLMEKKESEFIKKEDQTDSIGYLSESVDELEKQLDSDSRKIDSMPVEIPELELPPKLDEYPALEEMSELEEKKLSEPSKPVKLKKPVKSHLKSKPKFNHILKKNIHEAVHKPTHKKSIAPKIKPKEQVIEQAVPEMSEVQEVCVPVVQVTTRKELPLHKTGTNLIFGKQVHRELSAGELYENGMQYLNNRQYEKAIQCFNGVLKRTPNNIAARIRIQESEQKMKNL